MATTYKTTSLHIAVLFHTAGEIAGLIEAGADVNERDSNGSTPLHAAARPRCHAAIAGLAKAGADLDARDIEGRTPLHAAARADLEHRPPDDAAREDEPRFEELED